MLHFWCEAFTLRRINIVKLGSETPRGVTVELNMQEKTVDFVIFIGDLKFKCTNSSAIVNNKRHKIVCEVYNVEGIACNKISWKRGDTGEYYSLGSYNNINVPEGSTSEG